jgi:hypothetical protein
LAEVSLIRSGATTHSADNEQRLVDVPFTVTGVETLDLHIPANHNLLPPGWYLLFAVGTGRLPSDEVWLHIS